MKLLDNIDESVTNAIDSGQGYVQLSEKYYKLKVFQQLVQLSSLFYKLAVLGILLSLGLIFMAISAAMALGKILNNISLGYLCVAGLFFLFCALVYLGRRMIDGKIIQKMAKSFFD